MKNVSYFAFDLTVSRSIREEVVKSIEVWWTQDRYWAIPDAEFTLFVIKYGEYVQNLTLFDG